MVLRRDAENIMESYFSNKETLRRMGQNEYFYFKSVEISRTHEECVWGI